MSKLEIASIVYQKGTDRELRSNINDLIDKVLDRIESDSNGVEFLDMIENGDMKAVIGGSGEDGVLFMIYRNNAMVAFALFLDGR